MFAHINDQPSGAVMLAKIEVTYASWLTEKKLIKPLLEKVVHSLAKKGIATAGTAHVEEYRDGQDMRTYYLELPAAMSAQTFGEAIKAALEEAKLSDRDIAKFLDPSRERK
jgi:hypothetical protein